jgi:bifunctional enzyme CysN/CysC
MNERMNIVVVGHVDHGKSTLIGRLLADTGSLPIGKLDQIKRTCEINSKPFEYAFLLDALIDEQAQGITIDTARIFFKSQKREYIIIDAPGHIEFLKNMISGAARAEAAILLIDAAEGIAENSKRHAFMLSMLGIKQVAIVVNKMDLVYYSQEIYHKIKDEYTSFLKNISIAPIDFIPVSSKNGINITEHSKEITWYRGKTVIEMMDSFEKQKEAEENNFRMFVQGVYKFTANGDNRRIFAGSVNSGKINLGDEIIFLPSGKISAVKTIEVFNKPAQVSASCGEAIGLTLTTQVYATPSELICKVDEKCPYTTDRFRANIFWMGKKALIKEKKYKLKIGTNKVDVVVNKIESVLDASILEKSEKRNEVRRNEVAQCVFQTVKPISFDTIDEITSTSRFVIVDEYDIAGGGIITHAFEQEKSNEIPPGYHSFEIELKNLINKHFPHVNAKPLMEAISPFLSKELEL